MTILSGIAMSNSNVREEFRRTYCMSESAFCKILGILYPKLRKDGAMSNNSTGRLGGVVIPEVTMVIEICILAGVSYIDLHLHMG